MKIDLSEKEPFKVRCAECQHGWIAAYTPIELSTMVAILAGLHCPACGHDATLIFHDSR